MESIELMNEYQRGYQQALRDMNTPMQVIADKWSPTMCARCGSAFVDYEPCDDGYYKRATSLERCPYCGQMLDWSQVKD